MASFVKSLLAGACLGAALLCGLAIRAEAQSEFPPSGGKGRVVVVISGQLGAAHYEGQAKQIAALGYDVVLLDGNDMAGSGGTKLKSAVEKAQSAPHGLPGKVGVVGFSMGGGEALGYATRWPDLVSVVVVWYPATSPIHNLKGLASVMKVPVLMFAGEQDHYQDCCLIDRAEELAADAKSAGADLKLVIYARAKHDFVFPGPDYDPQDTADSWKQAEKELADYLVK